MTHCQFCGAALQQPSLPYCPSCGNTLSSRTQNGQQAFHNTGNAPQQPPTAMSMPQNSYPPAPEQVPQSQPQPSPNPNMPSTLFKKPGQVISQPASSDTRGQSLSGQASQSGLLGYRPVSQPHSLSGIQGQGAQFAPRISLSGISDNNSVPQTQQPPARSWGAPITPATPFPAQPSASTANVMPQATSMPGGPGTLPTTPPPQGSESLWQPPRQQEAASRPQRKGRALLGVWLTIFILCVVVVATVGLFAYQKYSGNPQQTSSSFSPVQGPSGASSVQQAASIILHAQISSGIDINYNPVNPGKNFAVGQKIYISFDIQAKTKPGYIEVKWYSGKHMKDADTFAHDPTNTSGYFSTHYDAPTQGAAELYWCTRANCSDAQLAQVLTFTIASYQGNA